MDKIKERDVIYIGESLLRRKAVVCQVYSDGRIEVVYLDDRNRAINEDMVWEGGRWKFEISGPCGGYADNYPRLSEYVGVLRKK